MIKKSFREEGNMFRNAGLLSKQMLQVRQKMVRSVNPTYMSTLSENQAQDPQKAVNPANPQNLPTLPLPKLTTTLDKYLKTVKPFLNENEFAKTSDLVKQFAEPNGIGAKLQKYLEEKHKNSLNWLEDWWLDVSYLGFREPVVIFSSPGQSLPFQTFKSNEDRLNYCSKLIVAAASYKNLIDYNKLPVDKMGKEELDMMQYKKLFGTCRIPAPNLDKLEYHSKSKHIIVVCNNHFYKIDIFNSENKPLSEKQILGQLNIIVEKSSNLTEPIGILTSQHRDKWASAYQELTVDPHNKSCASQIQSSLFLVCLDSEVKQHSGENRQTYGSRLFIHGAGSNGNAGNRWYDKTVQFVLEEDGTVGLTYEHSPSEGQPVAVMVDYIDNFIKKKGAEKYPDVTSANLEPKELNFKVNDRIKTAITEAKDNIDKISSNLELDSFTFEKFGKEFIKSQKLSPDSFVQIAMQYAFYRIHNEPGAHYESAATRKYVGGRTETIRSCSTESIQFAKAMLDGKANDSDKLKALKAAINGHKKYTIEAVNGFGVDRHLLGLKLAAKELKVELPELYKDPGYTRSTHMRLSTSQVTTKCDAQMSYGPLTDDGYGCCYNIRDDTINFSVSAFVSNQKTSATNFRKNLESSLEDMQNLLIKLQQSKL